MGQKVNPIGLRLGINRNWESRWFPKFETMPANVAEDDKIRKFVKKELYYAGIAQTVIEKLKDSLSKLVGKEIAVNIKEERKPQTSALLSAENVAQQLERRVTFRRAMKRVMQNALKGGAKGIKVSVSGRLGGAEMARTEWYLEGRVPLHTLRARIDYGFAEAHTAYGCIGIKVWIFKGEVLAKGIPTEKSETPESKPKRRPAKKRGK